MLLVKPPTRQTMLKIISGLRDGTYARSEVVTWQRAVRNQTNPLSLAVEDGYWYFVSFGFLEAKTYADDEGTWFIRDRDLEEYWLDIEGIAPTDTIGSIQRIRAHQFEHGSARWPLATFHLPRDANFRGLYAVRGTFEDHGDPVEHLHLAYGNAVYLIVRQFDAEIEKVMLLGTDPNQDKLRAFVDELGLEAPADYVLA